MTLNLVALNELIAHLEKQPEERFNMGYSDFNIHPCGTAACILGHGYELFECRGNLTDKLSISAKEMDALSMPCGWDNDKQGARRYPLSRAIATLKRLRDVYEATGQVVVDWGPEPGEEPKREWSAPVVSGGLPSSITDALNGKPLSLTVEQVDG